MASGQRFHWSKRSVRHESKFHRLQIISEDQIRKIDGYVMCPKDEFKVGRPTSDGTCVYAGLRISDGKEVAVKCMLTDNCEHLAENETQIYNMLLMETSPHVVRYLHYRPEATFTYIVLELCEFSLTEYVNRARDDPQIPFDPQKIIREILTGLKILHKQGNEGMILHRDLKPDNVLVDVRWSIRLADFGVSKRVGEGRSTNYTSGKGNAEWQAAESIPIDGENQPVVYKRKSDIQVAGMLSFYVLTKGKHPFGDISYERPNNIYHGNPVSLGTLTDPVERDFVSWLLHKNIDDRPSAEEALTHPYLKSIDDQFNFLVEMGNEPEIKGNTHCYVVEKLNNIQHKTRKDYPNGWKAKIQPSQILDGMCMHPDQYNDNITSLLRFLRNVKAHINDPSRSSEIVRQHVGEPATYFLHIFSRLPMRVHKILRKQAKRVAQSGGDGEVWINRSTLKSFF